MEEGEAIPVILAEPPHPNASHADLHLHLKRLVKSLRNYKNSAEAVAYQAAINATANLLVAATVSEAIAQAEKRSGRWAAWLTMMTGLLAVATIALVVATW